MAIVWQRNELEMQQRLTCHALPNSGTLHSSTPSPSLHRRLRNLKKLDWCRSLATRCALLRCEPFRESFIYLFNLMFCIFMHIYNALSTHTDIKIF